MVDVLERITQMRLQRNWSEFELAQQADLSQSTISSCYRRKQIPTVQTLEKICNAFGITLSQFFADTEDPLVVSPEQKELLTSFFALPPNVQGDIKSLINNILTNE